MNDESLREQHARLLRVADPKYQAPMTCDQLGVCQDRTPRCKGCKPGPLEVLSSEAALNVATAVVLGLALAFCLYGWCV